MFRGFFDESNKSPSDIQFVMAGWTATVEEWERFSVAWHDVSPSRQYLAISTPAAESSVNYLLQIRQRNLLLQQLFPHMKFGIHCDRKA